MKIKIKEKVKIAKEFLAHQGEDPDQPASWTKVTHASKQDDYVSIFDALENGVYGKVSQWSDSVRLTHPVVGGVLAPFRYTRIRDGYMKCTVNGCVKPETEFVKSGDKYLAHCKECHNARIREYNKTEEAKAASAKYRAEHPESLAKSRARMASLTKLYRKHYLAFIAKNTTKMLSIQAQIEELG